MSRRSEFVTCFHLNLLRIESGTVCHFQMAPKQKLTAGLNQLGFFRTLRKRIAACSLLKTGTVLDRQKAIKIGSINSTCHISTFFIRSYGFATLRKDWAEGHPDMAKSGFILSKVACNRVIYTSIRS